jgi:hypothetical protein
MFSSRKYSNSMCLYMHRFIIINRTLVMRGGYIISTLLTH